MIDNTQFTNVIALQLKYLPNSKDNSYYKVYRNTNNINQIRVSNHGTYLRTWIDKDYDPSVSTNISIVFTANGVPTNDCFIDPQTNKPFTDCSPCLDRQDQTQQPCKPRSVQGVSNKKRTFSVTQFTYNCQNLSIDDVTALVNAIKQAASSGKYNDPLANDPSKAAKSAILNAIEPIADSIAPRYNLVEEHNQRNTNRATKTNIKTIRLTEQELYALIEEAVKETLKDTSF